MSNWTGSSTESLTRERRNMGKGDMEKGDETKAMATGGRDAGK